MATYSNIGIKLITTGDESGTWGNTTNTNFSDILDEAIAGAVTYNISSDADVTLTVSDGSSSDARHAVINFTSTTLSATRTVTFAPNTLQKTWLVINSTTGGQALTFKQGSAGATVTVPNGESAIIYSDGAGATNGAVIKALDSFTNTKITTGTLNATTVDATNVEVTNVKAKDGTAAFTIADSTGKVTVSSELAVDNLNLSGNAITSTNSNGNIDLTPNGSGEVNITKVDIDAGTIDGATIATSDITVGAGKTLDVSAGTLTLANDQISGNSIEGGTINAITINTLTSTTVNGTTFDTNVADAAVTLSGVTLAADGNNTNIDINITPKGTGEVNLPKVDIDAGTIDGTAIGVSSASTGAFTTLITSSGSTLDGGVVVNEPGADVDFRVEGDTDANLLFVDASADNVGIGTSSPGEKLNVIGGGATTSTVNFTGGSSNDNGTIASDYSLVFQVDANNNIGGRAFNWRYGGKGYSDGTSLMTLNSSGNLGLGVTPAATTSSYLNAQVGGSVLMGKAGAVDTYLNANATYDSAWKYIANGVSARYSMNDVSPGAHAWFTAPSGTAGNNITFTQAMTLDASGNLGVGTTSPASRIHAAFENSTAPTSGTTPSGIGVSFGANNGNNGGIWFSGDFGGNQGISGIAGTRVSDYDTDLRFYTNNTNSARAFTERARITSGGSFQIGASTNADPRLFVYDNDSTDAAILVRQDGAAPVQIWTGLGGGELARITSGGLLLVNATTSASFGNGHRIFRDVSEGGFIMSVDGGAEYSALFIDVASGGYNAAATAIQIGKNSSNSRSINAGGTVNASGADYAEYMTKAGDFVIAKGDVCGIDTNGKLTNVYADAVSFVVKSTDPSYVGGDSWGADFKDDLEGLEAARQKVDRIAFAGQVPVNVLGATPGQYIVPVNDNGAIKGEAVSNPSFEQYQAAVGKVIALEDDGRARIIVKVV